MTVQQQLVIFDSGAGQVEVRLASETVWLRQEQMAELFERERSVITKHIRNVFSEGELVRDSVCAKFAHTAADGKTYQVDYYNLDAIISVGYRVKSQRGVQFRQWATRVLREHLTQGYTLNRQRFEQNADELEVALALVRKAAAGEALTSDQGRGLVDVIARYTQTFLWLQRYDEGLLTAPPGSPGGDLPSLDIARAALARLRFDLDQPLDATRWCVVDVETGGLDALRDPLLAIGAVRVDGERIALESSFEVGLTQAQSTAAENILIHGIGGSAQRAGEAPQAALLDWLDFADSAPRVAFHAGFDRAVLARETRAQLGLKLAAPWFDAAVVAPLLFRDAAAQCRQLDDWLAHFGIAVYARHGALADAYATAELWLILLKTMQKKEGLGTARQLHTLLRARRWLSAY